MSPRARVELESITRRFRSRVAVDGATFDLRAGEVLGLLGPNGAGKTTTMRLLCGYLRPDAGKILLDGTDITDRPVDVNSRFGYMPESTALYPEMRVDSYLRHWAALRGVPRSSRGGAIERVVHQCGLSEVTRQQVGTLSRGFRQRTLLAQALVHDPEILVLDEPTSGLDPRQVAEARRLIADLGRTRTVLLSSHLLSEVAAMCRRVVVLDRGRVVAVDDVERLTGAGGSLEDAYLRLVSG